MKQPMKEKKKEPAGDSWNVPDIDWKIPDIDWKMPDLDWKMPEWNTDGLEFKMKQDKKRGN